MRTIDADALKETFQRWNKCKDYNSAERNIIRAAIIAVEDQPTIDAIPVAWLREKIDGYASRLRSRELDALVTVLTMWQKEQEAR